MYTAICYSQTQFLRSIASTSTISRADLGKSFRRNVTRFQQLSYTKARTLLARDVTHIRLPGKVSTAPGILTPFPKLLPLLRRKILRPMDVPPRFAPSVART